MGKVTRILWFVSTPEDLRFLKVFAAHAYVTIDIFHINFITWALAVGMPGEQLLPRYTREVSRFGLEACFNVISKRLSLEAAQKAYSATHETVERYVKNTSESLLFVIPSGRLVHHLAAADLGEKYSVKSLYINYSNFPGYTFFDRKGTDCLSEVYEDPLLLEKVEGFVESPEMVKETFAHFRKLKAEQVKIPQVKSGQITTFVKELAFLGDTLIQYVTNVYGDRRVKFRPTRKSNKIEAVRPTGQACLLPDKFLFFPLQVSTDQQVLVNYHGHSIFKALDEAITYAQAKSIPLVTREHPAESRGEEVRAYIERLRAEGSDIQISNRPVYELIRLAEEVVTINSTVGLEAILNEKAVHFLGSSLYAKVTHAQLASYLNNYLIKVDYHSGDGMTPSLAAQILARVEHGMEYSQS